MKKKNYKAINFYGFLSLCCLFLECKTYSFSGTNLHKDLKTFSVSCSLKTAKGPLNIDNELKNKISQELLLKSKFKKTEQNGDLNFEVFILDYAIKPNNQLGSSSNLSITVELNYKNVCDAKTNLVKKQIIKTSDLKKNEILSGKEAEVSSEVIAKITEEIMQLTILDW